MAAFVPFEANVVASLGGLTMVVASTSTTTFDSTGKFAPCLYVANIGTGAASVRIDGASSTAAGQLTDIIVPTGTVHLFANPSPSGKAFITICGVTANAAANSVFVTPGQGGVV